MYEMNVFVSCVQLTSGLAHSHLHEAEGSSGREQTRSIGSPKYGHVDTCRAVSDVLTMHADQKGKFAISATTIGTCIRCLWRMAQLLSVSGRLMPTSRFDIILCS